MRVTFAAATTAAAALAVLVSGCGSPSPTPTPATTAAQPGPSATAPSPDAIATVAGELTVDEFLDKFATAQKQVKTFAMELEMESGATGVITASGVADQSGESMNQHMKMSAMGQDIEMIQLDGTVYMLVAAVSKEWIRMTPEQAASQGIEMPSDPGTILQESRDAFEKVEFVGAEELNGVATEHYRLTMAPDAAGEAGVEVPGYEVWLDEIGFTRKVLVDLTAGENSTRIEMTTDKVNEPVTIKAPKKWVEMPS